MPEIPLLGSLHRYVVASADDVALIIEGPLFTAGKINLNGWGIPEDEAADFAASFAGKPVRWCPHGITTVVGKEIIPDEHYCDAIGSNRAVVGTIIEVYANGKDSLNRTVYFQKARISDPKTVKGIREGTIPTNVSMYAYGVEEGADGLMHGIRGESESIVTEPAYSEAQFQWQAVAASFRKGGKSSKSFPYVPNNPSNYSKSTKAWTKPELSDFTDKSWDDLSDADKTKIRSCFAAVTDDTFGGCKLPHHESDGTLSQAGVNNAVARFSQVSGLGSARDAALSHLKSHQAEFKKGASSMPDEKPTETQTTLPGVLAPQAVPGVTINIAASSGSEKTPLPAADAGEGENGPENNAVCAKCGGKIPAYAKFCPACGAGLHASCPGCGSTLDPSAKFCSSCGTAIGQTVGDNSVAAASVETEVEKRVAAKLDESKRKDLAASIVQVQLKTGLLQEADVEKRTAALVALPAAALETELSNYCAIADKLGKPVEQGMHTGQIPVAAGSAKTGLPNIPMPANIAPFLQRFRGPDGKGLTVDDLLKYGVVGSFKGTFHQSRQIQEA